MQRPVWECDPGYGGSGNDVSGVVVSEEPFSIEEVQQAFPEFNIESPRLGRGSFKSAYRGAVDGEPVVLKVIFDPLPTEVEDAEQLALSGRLAREIASMARIDSPHVVRLIHSPDSRHIGATRHVWYLEPLYGGGTLEDVIAQGKFGLTFGCEVTRDLLTAVAHMWGQANLVHRDIKPGNVVFDQEGVLVVLDLGIAFNEAATAITSEHGASPRTDPYAAPEQFEMRKNATIDFRTDLFQVGLVAFEAITGIHPYWKPGMQLHELYQRLTAADFDRAPLVAAGCSEKLIKLIARLLAPAPSGRFRNPQLALKWMQEVMP